MSDFDTTVLAAVATLGEPYGVPLRQYLSEQLGRDIPVGAMYAALTRLERSGDVVFRWGEATPQRGGRRKAHYSVTTQGRGRLSNVPTGVMVPA